MEFADAAAYQPSTSSGVFPFAYGSSFVNGSSGKTFSVPTVLDLELSVLEAYSDLSSLSRLPPLLRLPFLSSISSWVITPDSPLVDSYALP